MRLDIKPLVIFILLILVCHTNAFIVNYNGVDYEINPISAISEPIPVENITYDFTPYPLTPHYRISQGQHVYVNDTIDIYGMGHSLKGIAWYGRWGEHDDPQYVRLFTPYPRDQREFWVDPVIFANRPGMWYQYYGNETERNGNLAAFYVNPGYRNITLTFNNGTVINRGIAISDVSMGIEVPLPPLMPDVYVADYLLARGDEFTISDNTTEKIWLFGRNTQHYDYESIDGNVTYNKSLTQTFEPGVYYILKQYPGKNTEFDVRYFDNNIQWKAGWGNIKNEPIPGVQPKLVVDKVIESIKKTDDEYWLGKMEVQEPEISISQINEIGVSNQLPYSFEPGTTLLDVRGYTNVANGTQLTFVMNPDQQTARTIKRNTYYTEAVRINPGNKSVYRVYIPINKNMMPNGMHTIQASTEIGGDMLHDFEISELPADSYVPNATIKYINDRNPWVPNMTIADPVVVEKVVTKVVTVEVTPKPEVVYEQQLKAKIETDRIFWENVGDTAKYVFIGLAILAIIGYMMTVVYRWRK